MGRVPILRSDLDVIRFLFEKRNCKQISSSMKFFCFFVFFYFIDELELVDPLLFRKAFIWREG